MNDFDEKIIKLKSLIDKSQKICVFTGAGISVPSGIPDFRSANGIYNEKYKQNLSPEEIISHTFFMKDTPLFYEFYKEKMLYPEAKPNKAHLYFASLEKDGKSVPVVTQNIDGFHTMAGSKTVCELHGSVHRNFCMKCHAAYDVNYVYNSKGVPVCEKCGGIVKPDVVLYEEGLDSETVNRAIYEIGSSDLLLIIGTSLAVYPAASFLRFFKGENIVLINKSATPYDQNADLVFNNDVIEVVKALENR